VTVNPGGGLVTRGHPLGATGIAQVVEIAIRPQDLDGSRPVSGARLGPAENTGGTVDAHAGYAGVTVAGPA
jgi:acetyl-CoA acetyltransferase